MRHLHRGASSLATTPWHHVCIVARELDAYVSAADSGMRLAGRFAGDVLEQ